MPPRHAIDISEAAGVRHLHFGSDWIQSAMRIARPWSLELQYTREMMAGLLLYPPPWPRQALLVGLGAGSLAKFIYRYLPECRITVVEINPQVEWVARQYFKLPDDPRRLQVVIGDGADFMLAGGRQYDAMFLDAFDPDGRAGALDTLPFYQACRARLSDRGLLAVNLLARDRAARGSLERIREAFAGRVLALPPCESGNTVVLAAEGTPVAVPMETLRERAGALKKATRLNLLPTLAGLPLPQGLNL